jgi:mono/diheme cytochrome c family protein
MKIFLTLLSTLFLLIGAVAAFVWWGGYNVAATVPHWDITHWFLGKVRERSIFAHSKGIIIPPLKDPKLISIGFKNYHAMCQLCHGAPGYSRTEISQGLYPSPPELTSEDVVKQRNNPQLYWVIKNGIKMTGMPAFGQTHSEDELLGIVVFVKGLPTLKPEEYNAMVKASGLSDPLPHHDHRK